MKKRQISSHLNSVSQALMFFLLTGALYFLEFPSEPTRVGDFLKFAVPIAFGFANVWLLYEIFSLVMFFVRGKKKNPEVGD